MDSRFGPFPPLPRGPTSHRPGRVDIHSVCTY